MGYALTECCITWRLSRKPTTAHLLAGLLCSKVGAKEQEADTEKKHTMPNFPRGKIKKALTALKSVV